MRETGDILLDKLNDLSAKLTRNGLEKLQAEIDTDKFEQSLKQNRDLCGEYAEFCRFCDKNLKNPCASAYLKMISESRKNSEIAVTDVADESDEKNKDNVVITASEINIDESDENDGEEQEVIEQIAPAKKKIRIAVARRKNMK